jgi:peptidoglycan/LPS O-acetylase OafA/YrhL
VATVPVAEQPRRFPGLDALRGVAALAIIWTHTGFASGRSLDNDLLAAAIGRFDFGVAIFFMLSGFLLYRPTALHTLAGAPRPRTLLFWWRRAARIFPALWLSVTVVLAVITQRSVTSSDWWHYLLLVQVYDHHETDPNLSQLWTLSVEVAFYAALPLLAALVIRHASRRGMDPRRAVHAHLFLVAALAVCALAFNIFQARVLDHTQALLWAPCYLDWFAAGMALAVVSAVPQESPMLRTTRQVLQEWASAPVTCWVVAAVLWLFTATQLGTPRTVVLPTFWQWTVQHYLFLAAAFLVMLPLVLGSRRSVPRTVVGRAGVVLGSLSYSVYLWHLPLLLLIQRELRWRPFGGHFYLLTVLTTAASLAVAALSWLLVERPILRHASRPWRGVGRGRPPSAARQTAASVRI